MASAYLSEFGEVLLFIVGGFLFVVIALFVSRLVRPSRPNPEKLTPYESGEQPVGTPWIQFNIRFYIIALIFLLFEVEIVFLFPWAVVFSDSELIRQTDGAWGWTSLGEMVLFILILGVGLAYAWVNGYLDWVKPRPGTTQFQSPVRRELYEKINERYKR